MPDPTSDPPPTVEETLIRHAPRLMALPGVVGTGEGLDERGTTAVVIFVARLTDELRARLPAMLEGHSVVIRETGEFHAGC